MKPSKHQGIENEPHMLPPVKPGEATPAIPNDNPLGLEATVEYTGESVDVQAERTVWDEPGLGSFASQQEKDSLTYANWLSARIRTWPEGKSWLVTLGVALCSGPWALLTSLAYIFKVGGHTSDAIIYCGFMPLVQEICKIAILLWIIEKRPYFFTGWFQIFVSTMASTVVFVTVLNLVETLNPFSPDKQLDWIIAWTAFFGMHLITGLFASLGLEKVWRGCITTLKPPKLEAGYRWFMTAYLIHVAYAVAYLIFSEVRWFMAFN